MSVDRSRVVRTAVYVERFVVGFSVWLEFLCCEVKCDVKKVSGSLVGMGHNFKVKVLMPKPSLLLAYFGIYIYIHHQSKLY